MDLKSMLNDKPAPEKKSSQSSPPPLAGGMGAPQTSPPPSSYAQNGGYSAGYAPHRATPGQGPGQQTPLYGPPSASISSIQSKGLTPLQTPSQVGGGQYPFPQQQPPLQSPASAHPGTTQYPSSVTTPGPRPLSHGNAHAVPQQSPSMPAYQQPVNPHHHSLSPTPSSHHSHTPSGIRQSPMATGYPSSYQSAHPIQHYHQSQPNTPLGPPPQIPSRHSNTSQLDVSSPNHFRTHSGASNGVVAGSPAQHHPSIGNLVESPSLYTRASPQTRRVSDHRSSASRERSVSVSPKTVPPPRPPSLGSRHSSQQEVYSARSSLQPGASVASQSETPHHVQPHPAPSHAQPQGSNTATGVVQVHSQTSDPLSGPAVGGTPLSHLDNRAPPQHSPQRMGMNHLLAPTQHAEQLTPNGDSSRTASAKGSDVSQSQASTHSPQATQKSAAPQPPTGSSHLSSSHQNSSKPLAAASPTPQRDMYASDAAGPSSVQHRAPLKRPAESNPAVEPPAKRGKTRRYTERPVWAHLAPDNPRAQQSGAVPNSMQPVSKSLSPFTDSKAYLSLFAFLSRPDDRH